MAPGRGVKTQAEGPAEYFAFQVVGAGLSKVPLAKVVDRSTNEEVVRAFNYLGYFVLIGWAIYPLGYMTLPFNLFESLHLNRNLVYNFGDVINKVGFGLVVYTMARKAQKVQKQQVKATRSFVTA